MSDCKKDRLGFYQCLGVGDIRHPLSEGKNYLPILKELVESSKLEIPICNCDDDGDHCRYYSTKTE